MFPEERKQDKENIYTNPDYISEKEKFESKLDAPFFHVKVNSNNSLEFLDEAKLKQWAKGNFKKITNDKEKEVNFTDIWIDDVNKLQKNEIIFDPNPNNDNSKN